jgi:hypothetical protein
MWSTRHHEYKFTEVTNHNLQQYIDLLNLYFSFSCFEFHALIADRTDEAFSLLQWEDDSWKAYVWLTRELLRRRVKNKVFAIVDLQGRPKKSVDHLEESICSLPNIAGCLRATSDMSVFLQLTDVLLGCVQFDWKDQHGYYGATSKRAEAKRELTSFIKAQLGVPKGGPLLSDASNFVRRTKPSPFTAWRWKPDGAMKARSAAMSGVHPANGTTLPGHSALTK